MRLWSRGSPCRCSGSLWEPAARDHNLSLPGVAPPGNGGQMRIQDLELTRAGNGVAVAYDDTPMVVELGSGVPLHNRWRWSFDGSLRLLAAAEEQGKDSLGDYAALVLTYADEEGPQVQQRLQAYAHGSYLLAETTALRDLHGAALEDSFFHTTFN